MAEQAETDNELSSESIKAIAESLGVKELNGETTAYLAKQALLQVCFTPFPQCEDQIKFGEFVSINLLGSPEKKPF